MPRGYFNPRPPRGGRPEEASSKKASSGISIHALREEGDLEALRVILGVEISIHALREEGDERFTSKARVLMDFNPRPPRGGRPSAPTRRSSQTKISIHALREEGDGAALPSAECLEDISIHALREEGDLHTGRRWRPA